MRMISLIHPLFVCSPFLQVICNGEVVMTLGGTKTEYVVDLWSGNHPFFQGVTSTIVVDEGRVNRFKRRYAGLDKLATIASISDSKK